MAGISVMASVCPASAKAWFRFRYLRLALFRILQHDIDAGSAAIRRQQIAMKQGFGGGNLAFSFQFFLAQGGAVADQVLDGQIVTLGPAVLKIRYRIDPNGVWDLPGTLG
jgi:hypothetical protein